MTHIYETALRIKGEAPGLAGMFAMITGALTGHIGQVAELQKGFAALRPAVLGVASELAGWEILKGLKDIAKHGDELMDQQNQMERLGRSHLDTLKLTSHYYQDIAKSIPTANAAEFLKTVGRI